ncbi:MAG: PAS domain S-box protein [Sediminibacterium sp.]|nr:PAS domain S-box protein [Sediminibacterium sp.]
MRIREVISCNDRSAAFNESSSVVQLLIHKDGKIIYGNNRVSEMFGYDASDVLSLTVKDLLDPHDSRINELLLLSLLSRKVSFNTLAIRKNKEFFPVSLTAVEYYDNEQGRNLIAISLIDITSINKADLLLQETSQIAKVGGWELDLESKQLYWTSVTKEIHEVPADYIPTLEKALGFYHGESCKSLISNAVNTAIRTGAPYDIKVVIETGKGNIKQVSCKGSIHFENGIPTHLFGTIQDITEQEENQQKLEVAVNEFNKIMDTSLDIIGVINKEGVYVQINKAAERVLGYTREEMIGKKNTSFILEEDLAKTIDIINKVKSGVDVINFENRYKAKDGNFVTMSWSATSDPASGFRYVVGRDISAKIKNEQQLKLLESAITNTKDAVVITESVSTDESGPKIVYVNTAFTKMTGYTKEEILGKTPKLLHGPETDQEVMAKLYKAVEHWESCEIEVVNYKKNGEPYWVNFTAVPVPDNKGGYSHWVAIQKDITESKRDEREKSRLINELIQNNRDLKQFSYITSHNLRSPLTNLLALIKLLNWDDIQDEENKVLLRSFEKSTEQLNATINDLLKVLILKEQTAVLTEPVSLQKVLDETLLSFTSQIKDLHAKIHTDFSKADTISFNKEYLESVFTNLIGNALKYYSSDRSLQIDITSKETPEYIQVSFKDNGIGIDLEKNKGRIFKLFQTFHHGRDSKGVGLYMVETQLQALGGKIDVESEVNKGSTFTVSFKKVPI